MLSKQVINPEPFNAHEREAKPSRPAGPFIHNAEKISGTKRSIKITDHFTCTSANVIYCITYTLCKKLYIGETGKRLGDRFRENLRGVEKDTQNTSKPVARHSSQSFKATYVSLRPFPKSRKHESRKTLEHKLIFQIGTLSTS